MTFPTRYHFIIHHALSRYSPTVLIRQWTRSIHPYQLILKWIQELAVRDHVLVTHRLEYHRKSIQSQMKTHSMLGLVTNGTTGMLDHFWLKELNNKQGENSVSNIRLYIPLSLYRLMHITISFIEAMWNPVSDTSPNIKPQNL